MKQVTQHHFKAPWWAKSPHVQTILPVMTKVAMPTLERQRLELSDGDFIDLDWLRKPTENQSIVVLLHGLEGSAKSHYIRRMLQTCKQHNQAAVVHHHRSCSGEANRLARSYHSGDTQDLQHTLITLKRQFPSSSILVVGYSLGGNVLTKYLGEKQSEALIERAVVISAPLRLDACAEKLEKGFSKVYQKHLINQLQYKTREKVSHPRLGQHMPVTAKQVTQLNSFYKFDHQVTAPLNGFTGVDDYYQRASGLPYLSQICVPTLVMHARDDPFMTDAVIPTATQISDTVEYELHHQGGHVGFIDGGTPLKPRYYLERRIYNFLTGESPC